MKTAANSRQVLERWRWPAISLTIIAGLLVGLACSLWQEQPYQKRSVPRLIADPQEDPVSRGGQTEGGIAVMRSRGRPPRELSLSRLLQRHFYGIFKVRIRI
jgi:hypothetical protein